MAQVNRWLLFFLMMFMGLSSVYAVKKEEKPLKTTVKKVDKRANPSKKSTTLQAPKKVVISPKKQEPSPVLVQPTVKPQGPVNIIPKVTSRSPVQRVPAEVLQKIADQKLIVLDPGHGGYDVGARYYCCDEKSLALSIALLTKKHLTDMGYRVILTRSRDVFIPLETRAMIANETKGKLFVSIHCNAAKNSLAKGVEIFYYTCSDKWRSGSSKKLASRILSKVIEKTGADDRGVKEGNFFVLRETKMPSIIVETGFMTHPDEIHLLKDILYRDKIAKGISEGIDNYFKI
jgi:N-acetylmuramoyl-L-alanine amidase